MHLSLRLLRAATLTVLLLYLNGCSLMQSSKLLAPEPFGLTQVAPQVYIENTADAEAKEKLGADVLRARQAIAAFYGEVRSQPSVHVCLTEQCYWRFGGRGELAKVFAYRILISPRAFNWHFIAHEWSHAEMLARLNFGAWRRLPQWFDDGVAVAVSQAPEHSEEHWQYLRDKHIPRPTRQELYSYQSLSAWIDAVVRFGDNRNRERKARGEPEIHSLYTAAGHEVRLWLTQVGRPGLLAIIDKLNQGADFAAIYTPAPQPAEDLAP